VIIPPSLALFAAQAWVKVAAVLALAAALLFAGFTLGVKLTKSDWAQERSAWNQERAALAVQYAAAEKLARLEERRRADEAQRVADQLAVAQAATAARAARAERAADSLRDTIARLNGRPVPDAPSCPSVAGYAREAAAARELLGACADEYRGLAAEADRGRDQLTGLLRWVDAIEK
jgi:hypothetical protein